MGEISTPISLLGIALAISSIPAMIYWRPFYGLLILFVGAYLYGGVPTPDAMFKWFRSFGMYAFIGLALVFYVYATGGMDEIEKIFKNSVVIVVIAGLFLSPLLKRLLAN